MARGSGWRWAFVPRWLVESEAFLKLEHKAADLLFRIYLTCDAFGRFSAGPNAIQRLTGIFDPALVDTVRKLDPVFVDVYEISGCSYGQIVGYDDDAPGELIRKRGASVIPDPPTVRIPSANRPDTIRTRPAEIDKRDQIDKRREDEILQHSATTRARARDGDPVPGTVEWMTPEDAAASL